MGRSAKRSAARAAKGATGRPRVVLITLDDHVRPVLAAARTRLRRAAEIDLRMHVAADWHDPKSLDACLQDLERATLVIVTQMFLDEHFAKILPTLAQNRTRYTALAALLSAPEVMRLTRLGRFSMAGDAESRGRFSPARLLRHLRGRKREGAASGRGQMRALKNVSTLLRFVPGTAQDVRAYLRSLQYWLGGSEDNIVQMVRFLVDRYVDGVDLDAAPPVAYPEVGLYHPDLPGLGIAEDAPPRARGKSQGRVGLLVMRSHVLGRNTAHYDALIRALESRGIEVTTAFASALDASPAIERFFQAPNGAPTIDALVSLTGFSLIGGPAYNDAMGTRALLERMGVPYYCLQPLEFQTIEEWNADPRGLNPLQAALMVSIPELEGAIAPTVFGGRAGGGSEGSAGPYQAIPDRVERVADRLGRLIQLRRSDRAERRVGIVLFNFPPNSGNVGTAAYLDVFASLHATLRRLADEGYTVDVPSDAATLQARILEGNAERFGTPANVHAKVHLDDYVRGTPWLEDIEAVWGPAPGTQLTDGRSLLVLGERFGNVFVGVQPPFGYEGDPMRLLFEGGFAPTHAFSAFYRWLNEHFGAHALLHFGTHGALEFMPGKQVGLSGACWPERLIADAPNFYVYAANNPSEGTLAKRRAAATLVSHRTPPVLQAGLYRGLADLRATLERYFDEAGAEDQRTLAETLRDQAVALKLVEDDSAPLSPHAVDALRRDLVEMEQALIPHGLHVLGSTPSPQERIDLLAAAGAVDGLDGSPGWGTLFNVDPAALPDRIGEVVARVSRALVHGGANAALQALGEADRTGPDAVGLTRRLAELDQALTANEELGAVVRALDGAYLPAGPGGDLLRRPDVLPSGRNLFAFDPYRVPDAAAMREGTAQVERLLERYRATHGQYPRSVAMVLWGSDNLKRGAAPVAQVLALMGARPRFDSYGRLTGADLIPLNELGRPRIDVITTTSGVFRDLLPLQLRLIAEAAGLAAAADEPETHNYVRAHSRSLQSALGCAAEMAALRVFSNAEGAYGANVNLTVDHGSWDEEEALGHTFVTRKGFAYGQDGRAQEQTALLERALASVSIAYQNLDSIELGVSDVDQYFDSLGGLVRAARNQGAASIDVLIGDETTGAGTVRSLDEQIALETRTRVLNPRWYEAMLAHGHQGVREIETRVTAAVGWSATTSAVGTWVYEEIGETFVLDEAMRRRLAELNPAAASKLAQRVLEASDRGYWTPDDATLEALEDAAAELEDRLEGIIESEVAA